MSETKWIKAYKGFNKDMTCRGFQYEEGKEYETNKAELCKSGFHACLDPIECFEYYAPGTSEYHEVEIEDNGERNSNDTKVVGKKIKVGAKLSVARICELHFNHVKENYTNSFDNSTGDCSAASNTGFRSAASVSGEYSVAVAVGYCSRAKANIGSAIVIAERDETGKLLNIKSAVVDGKKLKADTWYTVRNNRFVQWKEGE